MVTVNYIWNTAKGVVSAPLLLYVFLLERA